MVLLFQVNSPFVMPSLTNAIQLFCKSPVIEVGLEIPVLMVKEDVGMAELCVVVNSPVIPCPVIFPFEILFTTSDITAGKFELTLKHKLVVIVC